MRPLTFLCCLLLAACGHGEPFGPGGSHNEGPRDAALPRQLTFSPFDDRSPHVRGEAVLYSQAPIGDDPRARCLAVLPVEGGQALSVMCPPATVDTFLQTWDEPAWSPDSSRLAFLWVRSPRVSALGAWTHELVVSPAGAPAEPVRRVLLGGTRPDGRHANTATQLHWLDGATVRFVVAYDSIWKVKDGGPTRFTDSAINPVALVDLDVGTGVLTDVPGGDSVVAWAPAAAGGFWIVRQATPGLLERVDAAGGRTVVGAFGTAVTALTEAGARVVAGGAGGALLVLDPDDGSVRTVASPADGPIRRLGWYAAADRLLVAAEPVAALFGSAADLWLVGLP